MTWWKPIINNLPTVQGPTQKKVSFKEKMKWTLIILSIFFIMSMIPLFGLTENQLQQFEFISIILGAEFGSIMSLGIGPIVTASIVLQLLNGSGIVKFNMSDEEGRKLFQGVNKLLAIFFVIFEACIYVFMGGLSPDPALAGTSMFLFLELLLVLQLFIGGIVVMMFDEVLTKWGFGSGISLFIAAGVSRQIFVQAFSPLPSPTNPNFSIGKIPQLFQALKIGEPQIALLAIVAIIATFVVFAFSTYAQSMKIEIPLSFGRIRGHGIRWPLSFMYTSNIPVILVAALLANIQLWARLFQGWVEGSSGVLMWISQNILGQYIGSSPTGGLAAIVHAPNVLGSIIKGSFSITGTLVPGLIYLLIMMIGSVIFSWFWVQTSGMDAGSVADQIMKSGLQIPGFRTDKRILEKILTRYINPLTIMGALTVGFLAAFADLTGALSRGTGILLTVMIVYRLYEDIAKQHMMDMNPMLRKFMK